MPKYIKILTDSSVSNATPPEGAISLFYTLLNNKVVPKAKLPDGTIVQLSGSNTEPVEPVQKEVVTITDDTPLDYSIALVFKLKVTGPYTPSFINWSLGDTGKLVLYGGSKVTIGNFIWDGLERLSTNIAVVTVMTIEGLYIALLVYLTLVPPIITLLLIDKLVLLLDTVNTNIQTIDYPTYSNTDIEQLKEGLLSILTDIATLPAYSVLGLEEDLTKMNNNVATL